MAERIPGYKGAMMNLEDMTRLEDWVGNYINEFASDDQAVRENIDLKRDHTYRVRDAILDIGESLDLSVDELRTAEACALLHDIGRFEQYRKYRTFSDIRSENHAELGAKIIREKNVLDGLEPDTADIIVNTVGCHNLAAVPASEKDSRRIFFLKLMRDADKIDIWKVVTDWYLNPNKYNSNSIGLDLPDNNTVSDSVYNALKNGKLASMKDLRSLNDFKLLQIGWIYDLNFPRSFGIVKETDYLGKIYRAFSVYSDRINEIYRIASRYINDKIPD